MSEKEGVAGFIDVETTGLDPETDEIIELSIVVFRFNRETGEILEIIDEYTGLREPNVPIKRDASKVHGIYRRHVKGKSLDTTKIREIIKKCGGILIAHNAEFDKSFFDRMFKTESPIAWYCSMKGIDWKGNGYKSRGLHKLLAAHGIEIDRAHRAAHDVKAAIALLSKKNKQGEYYLKELLSGNPINESEILAYKQASATVEPHLSSFQNQTETDQPPKKTEQEKPKSRVVGTIVLLIAAVVSIIALGDVGFFIAGIVVSYLMFRNKR